MKKTIIAALCCAAMPAAAQAHVHTAACNHGFEDNGVYQGEPSGNVFTIGSQSGGGLKFILNDLGGVGIGTQARAGFEAAAARFSSFITDDITIRLDVAFVQLGPNILGSAGSTTNTVGYSTVRNSLITDVSTSFDSQAVSTLTAGPLSFVTNEPPTSGAIDSRVRLLDNNNSFDNNNLGVNTAIMKALGLTPTYAAGNTTQRDATISFSTLFNWDFDPTDGITPGTIDFVGVAAHEIGHSLGFRSGVDTADVNALPGVALPGRRGLNNLAWGTVNDLFRYGEFEGQTIRDWSIGGAPCTSIDGGQTCLGLLSTGRLNGDGRQASHWKDDTLLGGLPIGLMDPTASGPGGSRPPQVFTLADVVAFDVLGYNVDYGAFFASVPEPQTWAMMILGFGFIGAAYRRRQNLAVSYS